VRSSNNRKSPEQLRQQEERLRLLTRATRDAVWDWDIARDVVWRGEGYEEVFGYGPADLLPGQSSWSSRVHDEDRERVEAGLRRMLDSHGQFWADEYRFRRGDGTFAHVHDRGYVVYDGEGKAIRMVGSMIDISERKRSEEELRDHREKLSSLSQRVLEIQETERRLIARQLHDEVGQLLTATRLTLQAAIRAKSPQSSRAMLREGLSLLDQCMAQVRSLSLELRPSLLDDLGLPAALRWYLDRQAERAGFVVQFDGDIAEERLPAEVETACYRVIQEAVTNVARHARARQVTVTLSVASGALEAVVHDDGVGFDVAGARARAAAGSSLGILGMEERVSLIGGSMHLESAPGRGTRLVARVPLASEPSPIRATGVA